MFSNDNKQGLDATVIVGALLLLSFLGPVIFSGTLLLPLVLMILLIAVNGARSWLWGFLMFMVCIDVVMAVYYFSPLPDYPVSEWKDIVLTFLMQVWGGDPAQDRASLIFLRYLSYSLRFLPLGFLFWFGLAIHKKWHRKFTNYFQAQFIRSRNYSKLRQSGKDTFVGIDKKSGSSVLLSEDMRRRHTQILGATGYGKTESALMSLIRNDIKNGRGMILIDGKGDIGLRDQIMSYAEQCGREDDLRYLSYSHVSSSMSYNPLLNGSSAEIRDRIVESLEWSEEYYKKCASSALLLALQILEYQKRKPTLELLRDFLILPKAFGKSVPDTLQLLYRDFCDNYAKRYPEVKGLMTDLNNIILSGAGSILSTVKPDIDFFDAVIGKKIVILQVSTLDYGMTARTFGRMAIQDLKAVCGMINRDSSIQRDLFSVYIDEFESFAHESFNELLSKARSAGMGITISHQSMGDLEKIGPFFQKQITENTNNKIILHINDEETVEYFANMSGTKPVSRTTYQVEEDFISSRRTGTGSRRDVEEFIVHPNVFRNLNIGEAVVMTRNNGESRLVKLDRPPQIKVLRDYPGNIADWKQRQREDEAKMIEPDSQTPRLSSEIF